MYAMRLRSAQQRRAPRGRKFASEVLQGVLAALPFMVAGVIGWNLDDIIGWLWDREQYYRNRLAELNDEAREIEQYLSEIDYARRLAEEEKNNAPPDDGGTGSSWF